MKRLLFVCTGNVCRSFAAEKLFNKLAEQHGCAWRAESCGVGAEPYFKVPVEAADFLRGEGVPEWKHAPRLISEKLVDNADLILVMEKFQRDIIAEKFPQSERKMDLIMNYCGLGASGLADPVGGDPKAFSVAFDRIKRCVDCLARRFSAG